eukprot:CAMPEP_0178921310 /NCGR_PEP_ID=MMETSP0786-20121207/15489_1 /TAXON_ID=186022 /ORGANISM="Thalassionema frauenfeldii, Strain CCMP 1798" /LENGTH=409 /DNA_ID=CAMNT_0020595473 /DNA_START=86 /DNA_END=1315 /DNA_ORIENTATION=+
MKIALTCSLLVSISLRSCDAFVPLSQNRAPAMQPQMSSSTDAETSSTTASASTGGFVDLEADYAAAYAKAEGSLTAAVPDEKMAAPLLHFTKEYLSANQQSFKDGGDEVNSAVSSLQRITEAIQYGLKYGTGDDKYLFGSSHKAIRGGEDAEIPIDFYAFGCNFFRSCMNTKESLVLGRENLQQAADYIAAGENVVFLANHQSEADPQVMSVCLEIAGHNQIAEDLVYVAGHKVTTDTLAIPFSMGRNLICIHSKKHIDAQPETKSLKQKQNLQAMNAMLKELKKGGTSLWVAPSGGRDRRDVESGEVPLAPFDSKTIDMFRLMGNKSKVKTHYYPLSMVTYDLCPPPDYVEAGVGEERNVRYVPVGIACGKELISEGGLEKRHVFCEAAMNSATEGYEELLKQFAEKK